MPSKRKKRFDLAQQLGKMARWKTAVICISSLGNSVLVVTAAAKQSLQDEFESLRDSTESLD